MSSKKKLLFVVTTVVLGLFIVELLARGAFYFFGRYDGWGYPIDTGYSPYIGYAYDPYRGGRDKYGFRLDGNDDAQRDLTGKNACEFRVFMLGGSVVDGRHLKHINDALPARLEKAMNKQSDSEVVYSVINAGQGGYMAVQSALRYAFYIKYSLQPDFVVFLNGSNDSVGSPRVWPKGEFAGLQDNIHSHTERLFLSINDIKKLSGSLNAVIRNLSNYSAFFYVLHKTINDPDAWLRQIRDKDILKDGELSMDEWIERHVRRYMYNLELAAKLSDGHTPVAYFFQPTVLLYMKDWLSEKEKDFVQLGDFTTDFHGYPRIDSKQLYYFRVREEIKKLNSQNKYEFATLVDLSQKFDHKPTKISYFSDHVHYSPDGRAIITNEIYKIIKPIIQKQILNNSRFEQCMTQS